MSAPNVTYYARFERCKKVKTPKYTIVGQTGNYAPMSALVGRDGKISVYLLVSAETGCGDPKAPCMRLMAKNCFNFTGLRGYQPAGSLSGYAYGYPPEGETYGTKKKRPNPFRRYAGDGFLFIMRGGADGLPDGFELLVLEGGRRIAAACRERLAAGDLNDILGRLRAEAVSTDGATCTTR